MKQLLEAAGLEVVTQEERPQPSGRIYAEVSARRPMPREEPDQLFPSRSC